MSGHVLLTAMLAVWGFYGQTVQANRNDAFIGYTERIQACTDQLDDCRQKSHHDGCLLDSYNMRELCPISCALDRCLLSGTLRVRHRGYATPEGTLEYAKRWAALTAGAVHADSPHFRMVPVADAASSS